MIEGGPTGMSELAPIGTAAYPVQMASRWLGIAVFGWSILMVPAQGAIVLSSLEIDLWPEYDRPGVLVIYRASIAPGSSLPARLSFRIPAAAGAPTAVAELRATGELATLEYARRVDGDVAIIEFTATRPRIQIEYYDPRIERDAATRSFTFTWPGDYEVGAFSVSAQQPDLARDLTINPPATREEQGPDGLLYQTVTRQGVGPGEAVDIVVSYEKVADQLSVETMLPAEPSPVGGSATSPDVGSRYVALAAGGVLALIALLALALALRSRRRGANQVAPPGSSASSRFCTQCGATARPGDRFCHRCGTAIR